MKDFIKIVLTSEFLHYVKEHSDLWIGYWVSIFGGTGGLTLIIGNPVWEFVGIIGGILLTVCSIVLTVILTMKAWWGYKKIKQEVTERQLKEQKEGLENEQLKLTNKKQDLANQRAATKMRKNE